MSAHYITDMEACVAQNASPLLIAFWLDKPLSYVEENPRAAVKMATKTLWMQLKRVEMRETLNVVHVDDPKIPAKK